MEKLFIPAASPEVVVSSCSSFRSTRRTLIAVLLVALAGSAAGLSAAETNGGADEYWSGRDALDAAYAARLRGLADRCVELKLDDAAPATRDWIIPRDPRRQYLFLPAETDPAKLPADAPKIKQQWYDKFTAHRREQAEALFQLARSELQAGRPTRAFQLLHEVLHENPDHEPVRGALGYRLVNGRWRKPESVIRARRGSIAMAELGFDAGKHWVVESEHFRITTDHSEEAGTQLAEKLEELYDVWQQLFFPYWSSAAVLARRLEGSVPADRSPIRHRVVLFRERDEYVGRLKRLEPQIELTVGLYLEPQKTAYFYVDQQPRDDTYFHEVTHQLFSETGRVAPGVGLEANAWIIEGIAMYMESLRRRNGYYAAGGSDANRLQYARYRTLNEGSYLPLEQLAALGRRDVAATRGHSAAVQPVRGPGRVSDGRRPRPLPAAVDGLPANRLSRPRQRADVGLARRPAPAGPGPAVPGVPQRDRRRPRVRGMYARNAEPVVGANVGHRRGAETRDQLDAIGVARRRVYGGGRRGVGLCQTGNAPESPDRRAHPDHRRSVGDDRGIW